MLAEDLLLIVSLTGSRVLQEHRFPIFKKPRAPTETTMAEIIMDCALIVLILEIVELILYFVLKEKLFSLFIFNFLN